MSQFPEVSSPYSPAVVGKLWTSCHWHFPWLLPPSYFCLEMYFWQCRSHLEIMRRSAWDWRPTHWERWNERWKGAGSLVTFWAAYTPYFWFKKQIKPCPFEPLAPECIPNWHNWSMREVVLAEEYNDLQNLPVCPIILYSSQVHLFPPTVFIYKLVDALLIWSQIVDSIWLSEPLVCTYAPFLGWLV